jgi:signal transduction histidine kinase
MIVAGIALNTIFLVREIRRNEQHDAFINAVTHELKTPVASIRLYLETLQTREIDDTRRSEFYAIMLADSDRLLATIEQVLRAGRLGRVRLHHTPVDLNTVAFECVDLARKRHHLPDEAVTLRDDAPHAVVLGDADELRAAISNLIDNAVKYSAGDVQIAVRLENMDEGTVALRVADRGVGIPEGQLKHIFKRFYRIPGSRIKGAGLGLFIVKSVAKRHGGQAYAASEGLGRGSTFTLQLPVTR